MYIDTEISPVTIEVEGHEYDVAPKTLDVLKRIELEQKKHAGKSQQWELWLAILRVLIGPEAVRELFPGGDGENVDRMERIYVGTLRAFNANSQAEKDTEAKRKTEQDLETVRQLNQLLKAIPRDNVNMIGRGK